ncbi:hypothetical protein SAMN04488029_3785 [Reichenbachiella faecimaris]|uniref:Uncharacterized protein n=1 Tax=Reichenbachiella faecimaris TaxID=692418 RepID=A0A1W2GPY7_REIFA|nr:hypothetical protein [Reichenbachiella faecimaris]SMD38398.1 hypothetical protein SAMN04488029_3785 [Reichenbachiella faecimaris]
MNSFKRNSKLILLIALVFIAIKSKGQSKEEIETNTAVKERPFQISLVPGFGTSRGPNEGYTNQFSANVFVGYEHSLDGAEFGGLYNINKENVQGAQFAGFGNTVGGNMQGAQFGGFLNTVNGKVRGMQYAGFLNVTVEEVQGAQFAGYMNLADSIHGVQGAGLVNISKKSTKGAQVAGLGNWASDVYGVQIAGLVNRAKHVRGTQIGLINLADTVEKGVTVGLINIVKKGKLQFALENNEVIDFNIAFRSGTSRLYSVLFVGAQAKEDYLWTYGAGFGTEFTLKKSWNSNVELTTQSINPKDDYYDELNLLNRLSWNFGYQFANHLSFSAGPVLNVYVTNIYDDETGRYGNDIDMGNFYNRTFSDTNVKMWIGYNISIKF